MQHTTTYYSVLSGACAATASLFGKLSGLPTLQVKYKIYFKIILKLHFFLIILGSLNYFTSCFLYFNDYL